MFSVQIVSLPLPALIFLSIYFEMNFFTLLQEIEKKEITISESTKFNTDF
jgi:cell division protein FtsL